MRAITKLYYTLVFGSIHLLSLLPFWMLHRISDVLFILIYYVVGYRKDMVLKNIMRSFPEKSEAQARRIRKNFFRHFSDLMIESVKSATMGQKEFQKRYYIINQHLLDTYHKEGKSILILSPHTGNWEWIFSLVDVIPFNVYAVYQRLTNPSMDQYIRRTRERFGAMMIPTTQTFKIILEAVKRGDQFLTWFAADQSARPGKAQWVWFLNQDTSFHKGYEDLAKVVNQPVLFLDIRKVKRSFYQLELHVITNTPRSLPEGTIVTEFARLTEKRIREDPAYWLWSHNRWKHKRVEP